MDEAALLMNYQFVAAVLFGVGVVGFLARRNMIVMFLSVEMMLQGVSLSLAAFGRYHNDWDGQLLVIFIITVATCEAAIALALVLMLVQRSGNLDIVTWQNLREESVAAHTDMELPEPTVEEPPKWPVLTPSGVEPKPDEEEIMHRSGV